MNDFIDPKKVLREVVINEGSFVADLGCGLGSFSRVLSGIVGSRGRVFAVEVQRDVLSRMQRDFHAEGISNVEGIWGDIEKSGGTKIQNHMIDLVVVSNTLFLVEDKITFLKEVKRILKKGGHVLLVDWTDSFSGMGPKIDHVVTESKAKDLFVSSGFTPLKSFRAGAHHYGVIFELK